LLESILTKAVCLRKFHPMIADLVRGASVRYVRQQNLSIVDETTDLSEFLFGSERASLAMVRPVLMDLQHGNCFYCHAPPTPINIHVDHFIPWARYPVDLGHNFVLADSRCNGKKRDRLPACEHLQSWTARNISFGDEIRMALEERGMASELAASNHIAHWAYSQTEAAGGLTWVKADDLMSVGADWHRLFQ
jgi:5-methylcytosine-specific restriction endonuclease McrA